MSSITEDNKILAVNCVITAIIGGNKTTVEEETPTWKLKRSIDKQNVTW